MKACPDGAFIFCQFGLVRYTNYSLYIGEKNFSILDFNGDSLGCRGVVLYIRHFKHEHECSVPHVNVLKNAMLSKRKLIHLHILKFVVITADAPGFS